MSSSSICPHHLILLLLLLPMTAVAALAITPPPRRTVLVTGGAGYIGSHTSLELLSCTDAIYRVIVSDNLDNSSVESLERVRKLVNAGDDSEAGSRLLFRQCDILDRAALEAVLREFPDITSCIHFAGKKAVGESVAHPLDYYDCNVSGTVRLLQALEKFPRVRKFVFSSSATVYGDPEVLPIVETARLQATNPYGRTKLFIEEILRDLYASQPESWDILILRYFNPIGAHPSGLIGEDPRGIPNNLMPFIAQVCVGRREKLSIYGNDYDTPDGTGVRDFIHVVDLAKGHVAALNALYQGDDGDPRQKVGCREVNLGTGQGVSVLELVEGMRAATQTPVPYQISDRRPGDVAAVYADASLAQSLLGWRAELNVQDMCRDTWQWQKNNPNGYRERNDDDEEVVVVEESSSTSSASTK
jgi:UDP-glucose 4-epimerase